MILHQGYFGATASGHDLIACRPEMRHRFLRILDRTDLQGIPPTGLPITSHLTFFAFHDDFVMMRTSPDPSAQRGGMMFTHVLLGTLESIHALQDVRGVLPRLLSVRPTTFDVTDLELIDFSSDKLGLSAGSIALANALLAKNSKPVAWCGMESFVDAFTRVWQRSQPELRALLTFAFAFNANDAHLDEVAIAYIDEAQRLNWPSSALVQETTASVPNDGAELLLGTEGCQGLSDLANELEWRPRKLPQLVDVAALRTQLAAPADSSQEVIRSLRLTSHLAPSPASAIRLKLRLIEALMGSLLTATAQELLSCRNLDMSGEKIVERLSPSIRSRVTTLFESAQMDPAIRVEAGAFVGKTFAESHGPWRSAVEAGLRDVFALGRGLERSFFDWLSEFPLSTAWLLSLLPANHVLDERLSSALPNELPRPAIDALLANLRSIGLPKLRAGVACRFLSALNALLYELGNDGTALAEICRVAPAIDVLRATIDSESTQLLPYLHPLLKADPSLLEELNLHQRGSLFVLEHLEGSGVRLSGTQTLSKLQNSLAAILKSDPLAISSAMMESANELGLLDFSRRGEDDSFWASIRGTALGRIIESSMPAVLTKIATGECRFSELASVIRERLRDLCHTERLVRSLPLGQEVNQARLYRLLTVLTEQAFNEWYIALMTRTSRLPAPLAQEIGESIRSRSWTASGENVVRDYIEYRRSDLAPALPFIKPLLGVKTRFRLMFLPTSVTPHDFTRDDLWEQLEGTLVERFPTGPREHALWSRSKGEDSELRSSASGREQWHHALELVRRGAKGAPQLDRLLSESLYFYYSDPQLNWFYANRNQLN